MELNHRPRLPKACKSQLGLLALSEKRRQVEGASCDRLNGNCLYAPSRPSFCISKRSWRVKRARVSMKKGGMNMYAHAGPPSFSKFSKPKHRISSGIRSCKQQLFALHDEKTVPERRVCRLYPFRRSGTVARPLRSSRSIAETRVFLYPLADRHSTFYPIGSSLMPEVLVLETILIRGPWYSSLDATSLSQRDVYFPHVCLGSVGVISNRLDAFRRAERSDHANHP